MTNEIVTIKRLTLKSGAKSIEVEAEKGFDLRVEVWPVEDGEDSLALDLGVDDIKALVDFLKMAIDMQDEDGQTDG